MPSCIRWAISPYTLIVTGYALTIVFFIVAFFASLVPMFAYTVRRLHDSGKAGINVLWMCLVGLVPVIGPIAGFVWWLVWALQRSDPNPNEYGAPV